MSRHDSSSSESEAEELPGLWGERLLFVELSIWTAGEWVSRLGWLAVVGVVVWWLS